MDAQPPAPVLNIVGIGPGNPVWLTAAGRDLIAAADIVAGFRTVLNPVAEHIRGETVVLDYRNQTDGLKTVAAALAAGKQAVLCAQGDVSFSGYELVALAQSVCGPVRITPGISSVQLAMARAAIAAEESLFITFHKRADITDDVEEFAATALAGRRHLVALPRPWDFMPAAMARLLLERGVEPGRPVQVFERLALEGETAYRATLDELAARSEEFSDLSVVVVARRR